MSKISLNSDSPNWLTWVAFWELIPEQGLSSKERHTYFVHHAIHSRPEFVIKAYKGQYKIFSLYGHSIANILCWLLLSCPKFPVTLIPQIGSRGLDSGN